MSRARRAHELLQAIERQHDISINSYRRYMWRPDTASGKADHARHERAQEAFTKAVAELRDLIAAQVAAEIITDCNELKQTKETT